MAQSSSTENENQNFQVPTAQNSFSVVWGNLLSQKKFQWENSGVYFASFFLFFIHAAQHGRRALQAR